MRECPSLWLPVSRVHVQRGKNLQTIVQVLYNAHDEIFTTAKLAYMIERSEDVELFHQPLYGSQLELHTRKEREAYSTPSLYLLSVPIISK